MNTEYRAAHQAGQAAEPSVDLLIRSYYRDFPWLRYCLESIARWCRGFRRVVLVVPRASLARLHHLRLIADSVHSCPDYSDDYLGQQVTKLHADQYSDADLICHIDSDCLFQRPTTPADLLRDGRPYALMEEYGRLDRHIPWQTLTEQALGEPVRHEFMRRPPYTFPRWVYAALREHCARVHRQPLTEYVLSRPYRGFSEFNALGGYLFNHHPDAMSWTDLGRQAAPPAPCRVFWSRGPVDAARPEIERLLHSGVVC